MYDRYEQKLYIQFLSDYQSEHSTRSVSISLILLIKSQNFKDFCLKKFKRFIN